MSGADPSCADDTRRIETVNTARIGFSGKVPLHSVSMADSPGDRLRRAREAKGYKTASAFAAAHDITESTYRSAENGARGLTLVAAKQYAPLLGVTWQSLMEDEPPKSGHRMGGNRATEKKVNHLESNKNTPNTQQERSIVPDKIEVRGMAECGPDGWSMWNGEVIDLVDRPPQLSNASRAYAVYVVGDSMEPAFRPGRIAYIHPDRPIEPGCDVLVQIHPPEGEATPRAFLKHLVKRSGDKVVVEQYNPPKTFTLTRKQIVSMHRVLGSLEP